MKTGLEEKDLNIRGPLDVYALPPFLDRRRRRSLFRRQQNMRANICKRMSLFSSIFRRKRRQNKSGRREEDGKLKKDMAAAKRLPLWFASRFH